MIYIIYSETLFPKHCVRIQLEMLSSSMKRSAKVKS